MCLATVVGTMLRETTPGKNAEYYPTPPITHVGTSNGYITPKLSRSAEPISTSKAKASMISKTG